jgi:hypothetical protein
MHLVLLARSVAQISTSFYILVPRLCLLCQNFYFISLNTYVLIGQFSLAADLSFRYPIRSFSILLEFKEQTCTTSLGLKLRLASVINGSTQTDRYLCRSIGRAIAQAVSRWLPTAAVRVSARV